MAGFRCALDAAAPFSCSSPVDVSGLALGMHTFRVEATDLAGNVGQATHAWTVEVAPDTSAPVVTISGPPATTPATTATFTFTADEPAVFRCALDTAPFASCSSGVSYSGLDPGQHLFRVEATDAAQNQSVTGHMWTIADSSAPVVTISSGPSSPTTSTSARFIFAASEPVAFTCSLDGGSFATCASGETYSGLGLGQHLFEVRATDSAGNTGAASYAWTVVAIPDTTPPVVTVTSGPTSGTASTAAFTFTANEPAIFRCSLDSAAFVDCISGVSYSGITLGPHTFQVQGMDAAGNVGAASWVWNVTSPPPTSCSTQSITVGADADTWLLESSPTSNYGKDSIIKVDTKAGANARSLVRFQLPAIPAGCVLRDARLELYAGSYKTGRTLLAVPVGSSWTETSVTWSMQPAPTRAGVSTHSGSGYLTWNVTPLVLGTSGNASFMIQDATESGGGVEQGFHSLEKGNDNPPRLVVTIG